MGKNKGWFKKGKIMECKESKKDTCCLEPSDDSIKKSKPELNLEGMGFVDAFQRKF